MWSHIDPTFITTRETFPGEKSFSELCEEFFSDRDVASRASETLIGWKGRGLLVHMANPERLDDLFSHIERKGFVKYLATSYFHAEFRPTVYAIGRGTGIILDPSRLRVDHISVNDAATVVAPDKTLEASSHAKLSRLDELHRALMRAPKNEWSEVNVSFEGSPPALGIFALDGALSKLYATALYLRAGKLLPAFTYNRGRNELARYIPTKENTAPLVERVPVPHLRDALGKLIEHLP